MHFHEINELRLCGFTVCESVDIFIALLRLAVSLCMKSGKISISFKTRIRVRHFPPGYDLCVSIATTRIHSI